MVLLGVVGHVSVAVDGWLLVNDKDHTFPGFVSSCSWKGGIFHDRINHASACGFNSGSIHPFKARWTSRSMVGFPDSRGDILYCFDIILNQDQQNCHLKDS